MILFRFQGRKHVGVVLQQQLDALHALRLHRQVQSRSAPARGPGRCPRPTVRGLCQELRHLLHVTPLTGRQEQVVLELKCQVN